MKVKIAKVLSILLLFTLLNVTITKADNEDAIYRENVIFDVATDKYPVVRIPGMVVTNDGTILAYCEARESASDMGVMDIIMKRSTDGGRTWSEKVVLADGFGPRKTYNNPIMIPENGTDKVHMLYCENYEKAFYMYSEDNGLTWSNPVEITSAFDAVKEEYNWTVIATGPGHGFQMENGRLIVPVWLALNRSHSPSVTSTIYSDDGGKTWTLGEIIYAEGYMPNPNETCAVELTDGSVMLNMRNTAGIKKRALTYSEDGSGNWSKPIMHEELDDPTCFGSMVRLTSDSEYYTDRILSTNANNVGARNNLVIKMSKDSGQTWIDTKTIKAANAAYSDIAVSNDKKNIYVIYEPNDLKTLNLITFNLEYLTDGEESLDPRTEAPKNVSKNPNGVALDEQWTKVDPSWGGKQNIQNDALNLTSSGTQVSISNRDVNITSRYTLEMRVKADELYNGTLGNYSNMGTKVHDGFYRLMLDIKEDGIYAITSTGSWSRVATVAIDNNWHDYKAVVDNGKVELYMDGEKLANFTLEQKKDADYIQLWSNGTSADPTNIHQEYVKITNHIVPQDLNLVNTDKMTATASSEETSKAANGAGNVLDNNPNSFWHTNWDANAIPAELVVDMGQSYSLNKIGFLPRQDGGSNGLIKRYELYLSQNGQDYEKVSEGTWTYGTSKDEQIVQFDNAEARYMKLVALESQDGKFASLAEVKFYREESQIIGCDEIEVKTTIGTAPILPKKVTANLGNGDKVELPVSWDKYDMDKCLEIGEFSITGKVNGSDNTVTAKVNVVDVPLLPIAQSIVEVDKGNIPVMPETADVTFSSGEKGTAKVRWDTISEEQYKDAGEFYVRGLIEGTNIRVKALVIVYNDTINPDINGDGKVDIQDFKIVCKYNGKNSNDNSDIWNSIRKYDLNRDGEIGQFEMKFISDEILKS